MQGVKLGDMQATVQGFLSTGLFFVISNSTPLPTLSAERPHPTIFSLYVFLSVLGQAAVHTALLISFYFGALRLMPQVSCRHAPWHVQIGDSVVSHVACAKFIPPARLHSQH